MKNIFKLLCLRFQVLLGMLVFVGVASAQCPVGQTEVTVEYTSGMFNGENSWLLWDATAGTELACDDAPAVPGSSTACAVDGNTIELYTWETFGDNWNGATISLSISEDGSVNGCPAQSSVLLTPQANPGNADGNGSLVLCPGGTPSDQGGGAFVWSGSVECPACDIVCPDDIIIPTDPGVCSAFVELPEPALEGNCLSTPVDFVEAGMEVGNPTFIATGLVCSDFSLPVPALPVCVEPTTTFPMEICLTGDFDQDPEFSNIFLGTCAAPGAMLGVLSGGTLCSDTDQACVTVTVTGADLASGTLNFFLDGNLAVDNICGNDDPVSVSLMLPTDCDDYQIIGAIDDGIYPIGCTEVTFIATGSGTGSGANPMPECTMQIKVEDQEAPIFNCPSDQTVNLQGGECCQIIDFDVTATDNCGLALGGEVTPAVPAEGCPIVFFSGATGTVNYMNLVNTSDQPMIISSFSPFSFTGTGTYNLYVSNSGVAPNTNITLGGWTLVASDDTSAGAGLVQFVMPVGSCENTIIIAPGASLGFALQFTGSAGLIYGAAGCTAGNSPDGLEIDGLGLTFTTGGALFPARTMSGTVEFGFPVSTDVIVQTAGLPSGSEFPAGVTAQCYSAQDCAGNISECKFNITVNEINPSIVVTSLTCNDNINVSVDENCQVYINADMFLEGGPYGCYFNCYEVYIKDIHGGYIGTRCMDPTKGDLFTQNNPGSTTRPTDFSSNLNGCFATLPCGEYIYEVFDACNDNMCWGEFTVEDKLAPVLSCPPASTVNCTESTDPALEISGVVSGSPAQDEIDAGVWTSTGDADFTYDFGDLDETCSITDVNLQLSFDHSWVGDVTATLTSPSGTQVTLFANGANCTNSDNVNVVFDEQGAAFVCTNGVATTNPASNCLNTAAASAAIGNAVMFGNMQTQNGGPGAGLDLFTGEPCGGVWTLSISDGVGGDGFCMNSTSLDIGIEAPGIPLLLSSDGTTTTASLVGGEYIYNSCGEETLRYTDRLQELGCNSTINRTWIASDAKGNEGTCTQIIDIETVGFEEVDTAWFFPENTTPAWCNTVPGDGINLTCGADATPEAIYAYYEALWTQCFPCTVPGSGICDPDSHEFDADYYNEWLCNKSTAVIPLAFPYIIKERNIGGNIIRCAENFMENTCNMIFSYNDKEIAACGIDCPGNTKVIRTWTALDWCEVETLTANQLINAKDTSGPDIDMTGSGSPTVDIQVSVDPWGCAANFTLPEPAHLTDACGGDVTYTINGPATISYSNGAWQVTGAPIGTHTFNVIASDCCGNVSEGAINVQVADNTPPIPVAVQDIVLGLTYAPNNPEAGSAKIFAHQVDNGSHDGDCGPVRIAVRRLDEDISCGNLGGGNNPHNNNFTFFNIDDQTNNALYDRDDTDNGEFVKFCCEDLLTGNGEDLDGDGVNDYVIIPVELGVWGDEDGSGWPGDSTGDAVSITWANIRLEAKITPDCNAPPTVHIGCDIDETSEYTINNVTGRASSTSACGALDTEYSDLCGLDINQDGVIGKWTNTTNDPITINEVGMQWDVNGDGRIANYELGPWAEVEEDFFNKGCHYGPITRWWNVTGTEIRCRQIIIVDEPADGTRFSGSYYLVNSQNNFINEDGEELFLNEDNNDNEENENITWPYERDAVDINDDDFDDWSEIFVDCLGDDLDNEVPTWVDAHCSLIGWSVDSDTLILEGDACRKIIETYTVIDWCQYQPNVESKLPNNGDFKGNEVHPGEWQWVVIKKLIDTYAPVVTAPDAVVPVGGGAGGSGGFPTSPNCSSGAQMTAVAVDRTTDANGDPIELACPSEWLSWDVYVDLNNDWSFDYNWSSFITRDSDLNTGLGADTNGDGIPDFTVGDGADNADNTKTVPGVPFTINIPGGIAADCGDTQHRVEWTVYDGCGNQTSTTSYFTIQDVKAPTPYCVNLSTALMSIPAGGTADDACVELWAIDFDAGSFDNCTADDNLLYTFTDDPSTVIEEYRSASMKFTCDDLAGGNPALLTLPIYVWDGCGNRDFCLVNLRIVDNNNSCGNGNPTGSTIAGAITTEQGQIISDVEVMNSEMTGTIDQEMQMTDNDGQFIFFGDAGMDYEITASKNDDYLNGVSTIDLVMIQRHILGIAPITSPYKLIAADVNNDEVIDGRDLVELRKLILGIYTELPQNDSWRFVDTDFSFDMSNPWAFDEANEVYDLASAMFEEDFIGVKIGDVNESVVPNLASGSPEMSTGNVIEIEFENTQVEAGQTVELAVKAEVADLYGYQFTLATPGLELVNISAGALNVSEANFGVFGDIVTTSWNSTQGVTTSESLFTMTFKSTVSGQLADILNVTSSITRAEAYVGSNLDIVDIALANSGQAAADYALMQNEPNPFRTTTVVGIMLPEAANGTMTVYDVTGKVISVIKGEYTKGYNEIELSKSGLGASGVLYYQFDSGDFTATKKMIIIE